MPPAWHGSRRPAGLLPERSRVWAALAPVFPTRVRAPDTLTDHLTLAGFIDGELIRHPAPPALLAIRRPHLRALKPLGPGRLALAPTLIGVAHPERAQEYAETASDPPAFHGLLLSYGMCTVGCIPHSGDPGELMSRIQAAQDGRLINIDNKK
jgi:hypothetical protein